MRQLFTDSGFPKFGKTITVVVGEPVDIDDVLKAVEGLVHYVRIQEINNNQVINEYTEIL